MTGALARPDDLISAFLAGRGAATRRAYAGDLRHFAAFLGVDGARGVAALLLGGGPGPANGHLLRWRNEMLDRGLSGATVNRRLAAVRSMVKLGRTLGYVTWALDVGGVPTRRYRDTRGVDWETYERAVAGASVRDAAILRLLGDRGLRRGEVVSLDLEHVGEGCLSVMVAGKGRRGERERLTLAEPTAVALRAWIVERGGRAGPLFRGRSRKRPRMSGGTVYAITKAAVGCRPHGLRHAAITRALDVTGGDVRAVQQFSRHSRPETVICYDDARNDMGGEVARKVTDSE